MILGIYIKDTNKIMTDKNKFNLNTGDLNTGVYNNFLSKRERTAANGNGNINERVILDRQRLERELKPAAGGAKGGDGFDDSTKLVIMIRYNIYTSNQKRVYPELKVISVIFMGKIKNLKPCDWFFIKDAMEHKNMFELLRRWKEKIILMLLAEEKREKEKKEKEKKEKITLMLPAKEKEEEKVKDYSRLHFKGDPVKMNMSEESVPAVIVKIEGDKKKFNKPIYRKNC